MTDSVAFLGAVSMRTITRQSRTYLPKNLGDQALRTITKAQTADKTCASRYVHSALQNQRSYRNLSGNLLLSGTAKHVAKSLTW